MSRVSLATGDRSIALREGLLSLSRLLVFAQQPGTFSESLGVVAASLGVDVYGAYEADGASLVLVAYEGLSAEQRAAIERFPRQEDPNFIVARAAKTRRIVLEGDLATASTSLAVSSTFEGTQRFAAAAVPLVAGRAVIGVLLLLHRKADTFDTAACAFLETAAGMITLAHRAESTESRTTAARTQRDAHMGPLAMAGMLASHFAGDVRGPLASIALVLREQEHVLATADIPGVPTPPLGPTLRQLISEAQLALKRAQSVTDQIATAAQIGVREKLVFADRLRDAVAVAEPSAKASGTLIVSSLEGDESVLARRSEILPAFVAMITNAVQACERGPRTRRATVKVTTERDPRGVAVSIEDSGSGVPADVRSRIFEPFFSTIEGAGIGLTLAKHAIVAYGGHLEVAVSPSLGGALFRVVLPRAEIPKKQRRSSLSSATLRMVKPRPPLLWIDRDDVFLAGVKRALAGFDVRMAASAAEAEQMILSEHVPPELIFCEIDLPDKSGLDVHSSIARQSADLAARFVFVTDGVLSPERAAYVLGSGCPTLVKPIDLDEIRALVRRASGVKDDVVSERITDKPPPNIDDPFDD